MSLNCKEIDLILSELDLAGTHIEKIAQPSYDSLVLSLYKEGKATPLLLSVAQGACRVNALGGDPRKPPRPLRFQECLKSRIRGGTIQRVAQIGTERVLRFDIEVTRVEESAETVYKVIGAGAKPSLQEKPEGPVLIRYRLYARLWSGAGNIILAGEDGLIVDALLRRPKKGEVSGEPCRIEEELSSPKATEQSLAIANPRQAAKKREFAVRDLPAIEGESRSGVPGGSFNERIEAHYAQEGGELSRERLLASARERFARRERVLKARVGELEARAAEYRGSERLRELGDILMANQGLPSGGPALACQDFYGGGEVSIEIDPAKSIVANAQDYYGRYRKASSGLCEVESELSSTKASLAEASVELERIEAMEDPLLMARALSKGGTVSETRKKSYPGLYLQKDGWTILVGRSAKDNDDLLRHNVRGSDLWLHARDYSGAYVFVKARAGKSYPLDILLDAGNLALYYSKGREKGSGELYYTQVKYLRRAKDGPKGLVLPTQEKNLHIVLDEGRLRSLKELMGGDAD
jgi:predicted ribosome quality control (RQC) complex YloA/Tae2 family protein